MRHENYCLNLKKVSKLDKYQKDIVHNYYKDMLYAFHDSRNEMGLSIMNTLLHGGYLIDLRDNKINNILE